ncbi:hypothetical protein Tco_1142355 [Tanacetum coccineum]
MLHRLCRPSSIPLSFGLATIFPKRSVSLVSRAHDPRRPRANTHRLRHGLLGLVIDILEKLVKSRQTLSKAMVARNGFSQNMYMIAEMKEVDKKLEMRQSSPERGKEGNYGRRANPTPTYRASQQAQAKSWVNLHVLDPFTNKGKLAFIEVGAAKAYKRA